MIRVALIDDQPLFRGGIAMILDSQPDVEVVAQESSALNLSSTVRASAPDVILMDVRMPGIDGITATRQLVADLGDEAPKILVLTTFDVDEAAARAIEAGASGFVLKDAQPEFLLASVRAVADGSQVVAASATRRLFERHGTRTARPGPEYDALTVREREILVRAASGLSNAEIAQAEFLSEATVKTHISRILAKLSLRDRVQLVVYAYEHGLV
ncbi:response regulator transcription factor [Gordonia sp. PS3]|uniref:Putative two-component response regulator n=1 Tax=Gordonia sihwensis NBRC 108236 TaxID=1223544 RepID=L7LGJ9_9ACTN|nr:MULTISPECIES: response regulator transcription factor [Gordonia]AUH68650.1 DNA-binding response regulator [Gordonia sp. YC-JH1]KJR05669.1 LuxR family transcriptional regulator [Gordonia sihwensis]KXT57927.1 LuxR family transcriptional regulator [Gordonia sp. QH-12]MBY4571167.1 DNA-binding response regulator [Gordonia sihwensis]WFN91621.1 response regulator transcription factor [Gordonia sihwensis]